MAELQWQHGRSPHRFTIRSLGVSLGVFLLGVIFAGLPAPKVQAAWWTLETPHFSVHYTDGQQALAEKVAAVAEDAYRTLVPLAQHRPRGKTDIVLKDVSDQANGAVFPLYGNHMVLYPVFPQGLSYSTGFSPRLQNWLRTLVFHEFAHVLDLDITAGLAATTRMLFGRVPFAATPNVLKPPAITEGYAVYMETVTTEGARGNDPYYDMYLRAATLEDRLLTLDQALGAYPLDQWTPAGAHYLYGYGFIQYLADRFGPDVLPDLNWAFARRPDSLARVVEEVTRRPLNRLWQDWQVSLKERYARQREALEAMGPFSQLEPLGSAGHVAVDAQYAPNGRYIAYAARGGVGPGLRVLDLHTGDDRQVVSGLIDVGGGVAWRPDGKTVVYAKITTDRLGREWSDLWEYDTESGVEVRLTEQARAYAPDISSTGRLVYAVRDGLSNRVMVSDTGNAIDAWELWASEGEQQVLQFAWSPTGEQLAVTIWEEGAGATIHLMDVPLRPARDAYKSEAIRPRPVSLGLQRGQAVDQNPSWSPDGRFVLFDSDRSGVYNVYAYEVATRRLYQVTHVLNGAFRPRVSPDGTSILLSEYTADGYRLAQLPFDPPTWSPARGLPFTQPALTASANGAMVVEDPFSGTGQFSLSSVPSDGWTGTEDPAAYIHPYNRWQQLRPGYWLPLVTEDERGPVVGIQTGHVDALQQTAYGLALGLGLGSFRPSYQLAVEHRFGTGDQFGLTLNLADYVYDATESQWLRSRLGLAELSWRIFHPNAYTVLGAGTGVAHDQLVTPYSSEPDQTTSVHWLRLQNVFATRWERQGYQNITDIHLQHERDWGSGEHVNSLTVAQSNVYEMDTTGRVMLDIAAGAMQGGDGIPLGGSDGVFRLRAFPPKELTGHQVARVAVGAERRVLNIERGIGDSPFFFKEIRVSPFVEGGVTTNGSSAQVRAGAGVEFSLLTYLFYGTGVDMRVGVATPLGLPRPPRWYVTLNFGD